MNKILAILNSKYFLSSVIGISILVIIIGVLMVQHANEQAIAYENQKQQSRQESADVINTVKQLELLAAEAEAELKASQSTESGPPDKLNFTTESQREKVAQMKNKNPEQGTDDWCDIMMVKPDHEWTSEEHSVFAKSCL